MNTPPLLYDLNGKRVWVAGHRGMVGSAVVRRLKAENCTILTVGREELDLSSRQDVDDYVKKSYPDVVILAAAKVGGIMANSSFPADFLWQNLEIQNSVIGAAQRHGVSKLVFLGSSCIYPKLAPQPITEAALLTGPLEPTNEWYAIAKIAGIKLCQAFREQFGSDFISCMPPNLYGPYDNFDLATSHGIPALMAKAYAAKKAGRDSIQIWGSGSPLREFAHVDDCADAIVFVTKHYSEKEHINIGSGNEVSILDLARLVQTAAGLKGEISRDLTKPDGTPRKIVDSTRLRTLGWKPKISFEDGISSTYAWYVEHIARG